MRATPFQRRTLRPVPPDKRARPRLVQVVVEVISSLGSGVVFLRKYSAIRVFVDQCYAPGALMWWNGKHAMAKFWSGIVVVFRTKFKRPRSLNNDPCMDGEGRDGARGTIDSYRLSHHGKQ
jgi:hypothetical protein